MEYKIYNNNNNNNNDNNNNNKCYSCLLKRFFMARFSTYLVK